MMLDVPDTICLDLLDIIKVLGRKELNTVRLVVVVVVVGVPVPVGSPEITDFHQLLFYLLVFYAAELSTPLHSPFGQNFASHRCHFYHAALAAALQASLHNNLATTNQTVTKKSNGNLLRRERELELVQPERRILNVGLPVLCWRRWGARHFLSPCCRFKILHHQKI